MPRKVAHSLHSFEGSENRTINVLFFLEQWSDFYNFICR